MESYLVIYLTMFYLFSLTSDHSETKLKNNLLDKIYNQKSRIEQQLINPPIIRKMLFLIKQALFQELKNDSNIRNLLIESRLLIEKTRVSVHCGQRF